MWVRNWHLPSCHLRQLLSSGKTSCRSPAFLYHLFQVMRAQEGIRAVMVFIPVMEVFWDKHPYLISGCVWKEKKNQRKNTPKNQNTTKFLHTPKSKHRQMEHLLDGAVFEGKSEEAEKIRRMSYCPSTQRSWEEEKVCRQNFSGKRL